MNDRVVAKELVRVAGLIQSAEKGEVPEAFKKQWADKDKDNDGKESEPMPEGLKKHLDKKASSHRLAGSTLAKKNLDTIVDGGEEYRDRTRKMYLKSTKGKKAGRASKRASVGHPDSDDMMDAYSDIIDSCKTLENAAEQLGDSSSLLKISQAKRLISDVAIKLKHSWNDQN